MLFERFRRPRWQHPDPGVRRQEVARLSPQDPDQERQLRVLALEDADDAVRAAATKRLDDLAVLRRISGTEDAAEVREAASLRYRQLLAGGVGNDGGAQQRLAELDTVSEPAILAHVVRNAREERIRSAALERITDTGILEQVALNDELFRMRHAAVDRIQDRAVLDRIAEQGRAIDRRIARMARERAAGLREAEAERERDVAYVRELCEQARELVDRPVLEGTEQAEAERLRNRWQALGELPEAAPKDRFWVLMNRLESRLARAQPQDEASAQRAREELDAALTTLDGGGEPSQQALERLQQALDTLPASAETQQRRARYWLETGWRYWHHRDALDPSQHEATRRAAAEAVAWPSDLPVPPLVADARNQEGLEAGLAATGETREEPADQASETADTDTQANRSEPDPAILATLNARVDELDEALEAGHYKPARRALKAARHAAAELGDTLPAEQERRLSRGRARLAELADWWRFAVLPKQRDLCERMEALIEDDELTPPERARRIRELRDEWRATGGGGAGEARELWQRFNHAAERAFEPCRAYFKREDERKQANLAARQRATEQLESFMDEADLGSVDTEELTRIRDTARSDWKAASPVDRNAVTELSERFEAQMDRLTALIDERRQAARKRKQAFVDEAQSLTDAADSEAAAERAKSLQFEWRLAGSTWPSVERGLWRAFRDACNRIFEAREAERAGVRERDQAAIDKAERICADLESVAASTSMDAAALCERIRANEDAFRAIKLPRGRVATALEHRFARAESAAKAAAERVAAEHWLAGIRQVVDRMAEQGPDAELPSGIPEPLREALGRVDAVPDDCADRRRTLCVRLEIAAGVDSPEGEQDRRMQQQMDRLADGLTSGDSDAVDDAWLLLAEWLRLGGAAQPAERDRIDTAVAAWLKRDTA